MTFGRTSEKRASSSNDSTLEKSQVNIDVDKAGAEPEQFPPVPFFTMFRFSTRLEIFLDGL